MVSRQILFLVSMVLFVPLTQAQSLRVFYAPMRQLYVVVKSKSGHDVRKADSRDLNIYVGPGARVFRQVVLKSEGIQLSGLPLSGGYFLFVPGFPYFSSDDEIDEDEWTLFYETPRPSAAREVLIELDPNERLTMSMLNLVSQEDFIAGKKKPTVQDIERCEEKLARPRPKAY